MAALEGGVNKGATDALLGDYSDRPLPTPTRTPASAAANRGPTKLELIHHEALSLRVLATGQTPLLGEENVELLEGGAGIGAILTAAVYGAMPMIGKVDDDATANFRKASHTPMTYASRRDELGLNSNQGTMHRPPSELRLVTGHDDSASIQKASPPCPKHPSGFWT